MSEEEPTVVCDNGSGMVKAGLSGEDAPRCVFPSIVGTPKKGISEAMVGGTEKKCFIGDEAQKKRGVLSLTYPIAHGIITDGSFMELIWSHTFDNELRVEPDKCKVLLTEAPGNPKKNREKMTTVFFETFNVPYLYIGIQAILSLYSAGRTTGLVLDAGDGVSHTVPIYEGFSMPHAIQRIDIAGRDLTSHMAKLLSTTGDGKQSFTSTAELEIAREIKEKLCFVALDYEQACSDAKSKPEEIEVEYELPDKSTFKVGEARFQCPEALFKPEVLGQGDLPGYPKLVTTAIEGCDVDVRNDLYGNIVLSGGTTMYTNIDVRLCQEIKNIFKGEDGGKKKSEEFEPKIIAPPERKYSVWIGGSILSSLTTFDKMWVTRSEFNENGPTVIHSKCGGGTA